MASTTQTTGRIGSVLIGLFLFSFFSFFSSGAAEAATKTWVGASGGLWSADANWNPVGAPEGGDDIVFPVGTSAISVNDVAGFPAFRSLRFEDPHTLQGSVATVVTERIELFADVTIQTPVCGGGVELAVIGTGTPAPTLTLTSALSCAPGILVTGVVIDAQYHVSIFSVTLNAGATFIANSATALGQPGPPSTTMVMNGGTLRVAASGVTGLRGLTGHGTLDLSPPLGGFFPVNVEENDEDEFTGTITGNMVLTRLGLGTLRLSGPTTIAMMYVSSGDTVVAHAQTLANTTINIFEGATLTYDVSATRTQQINLRGTGVNGVGALRLRGGSLTQTHTTLLDNGNGTIAVAAPHQLVMQGSLNGGAAGQTATLIGDGTVVLGNATNNLQSIVVGNGVGPGPTLKLGVANALYIPSPTVNAGATLDLSGFDALIFNLAGAGRLDTGGASGVATLSDSTTFTGTFHGAGSVNSLPFTPQTLAGTHTLAGTFTTQSDNLVVTGTIPAAVRSSGDNVTLGPGSLVGSFQFTSTPALLTVGGAINPGSAITNGPLNLTGGMTFKPMLSGTTPRVIVNGTVNLSFAALDLSYAGTIPPGVLTLIANDGTDPILGIFHDVLDGGQVTLNGVIYVVDYTGGDGNDLTLSPPITTYHLSEGATGSFFDTDLLIANPWPWEISADVTFLRENATPLTQQYSLAPMSRRTIFVDQIAGMESAAFSTIVKPNMEYRIVVERTMRWDATGYGGHTEKATAGPATTWYFAEGSEGFFRTFLLLANPQTTDNGAHVKWLREGAPAIERSYSLPASSRTTIAAIGDPELIDQAFGITVTFDQPGVAERAMYFGGPPAFKGGHESAGVNAPSTTWLLAEGATGAGFDTFILVSNPGSEPADVTFTFLPASGPPASIVRTVPANSRITVNPEAENLPIPLGAVGTQVTASRPVIAERAQYWPLGPVEWTEAHNSFGVTEAARRWALAEGRVGGSEGYQTYILLANPGSTAATVTVDFLGEGGAQAPLSQHVTVPPQQRVNVTVGIDNPNIVTTFGTLINSDQPLVVERAMYWNVNGEIWAAGTNATATSVPFPF